MRYKTKLYMVSMAQRSIFSVTVWHRPVTSGENIMMYVLFHSINIFVTLLHGMCSQWYYTWKIKECVLSVSPWLPPL